MFRRLPLRFTLFTKIIFALVNVNTDNYLPGRVFAAGTIQWAWGLDDFGGNAAIGPALRPNISNPDVEIVTENILRCLKDGGTYCGEN